MERRKFRREFKLAAVKKVLEQGLSYREVAREFGIRNTYLHNWKNAYRMSLLRVYPLASILIRDAMRLRQIQAWKSNLSGLFFCATYRGILSLGDCRFTRIA